MSRVALALALLAVALPMKASAAQSWEDLSNQTAERALATAPLVSGPVRVLFAPVNARPNATLSLITNYVAAGPAQGGVPCFSCVNGAQTSFNVGLTGPYNYVVLNTVWQYTTAITDISLPNPSQCKFAWAITSGATKIDSFSAKIGITAPGGYVYGVNRNPPSPAFHGQALLTAKVTCGASSDKVTTKLVFQ
jgi:hypothetical protein